MDDDKDDDEVEEEEEEDKLIVGVVGFLLLYGDGDDGEMGEKAWTTVTVTKTQHKKTDSRSRNFMRLGFVAQLRCIKCYGEALSTKD